jgi:ABC-type Na+ efflux pump permease subunit
MSRTSKLPASLQRGLILLGSTVLGFPVVAFLELQQQGTGFGGLLTFVYWLLVAPVLLIVGLVMTVKGLALRKNAGEDKSGV